MTPEASALPPEVVELCETWLALVDGLAPGLVTGLHLRGGLALGEWRPGASDVDFVAVLAHRPGEREVEALRQSHAALGERLPEVPFDGMHLVAEDLSGDPDECPDLPCVLHRHFEAEARYDVSPVAWHELALGGVAVRGEPLGPAAVWTDRGRLAAFTRDNLDTYWRATADALAAMPSEGEGEEACCWCVLGVARLHHLLVTGEQTTKSGAGRWGLDHYPERFHRVLAEALRIRDGGPEQYAADAATRARDTADFTAFVVREGTGSR